MGALIDFEFQSPTRIVFGPGSCSKIGAELAKLGASKVLLVTDPGTVKAKLIDKVLSALAGSSVDVAVFDGVEANPTLAVVDKGIDVYRKNNCQALLAVGGGSSMDTAKSIGILATNPAPLENYVGLNMFPNTPPPVVAVPTTTGTGSEVTMVSVITDPARNYKMSIRGNALYPKVAILDPSLLATLPAPIAAATGMDALTHALEAYVSTGAEPISDALALQAITLVGKHLRPFVASRKNLEAAGNMILASNIAGLAFGNARLGIVHALAHPLGGYFNVPHGVANAIMLPVSMEYNLIANLPKFAEIARALGEQTDGLSVREAAELSVVSVRELSQDIGIPANLREVGVLEDKIEIMARDAWDHGISVTNPRVTCTADLAALYRKAM